MHSLFLFSLVGGLASVNAAVNNHAYRVRPALSYTKAKDVAADSSLKLLKRGDYIETATSLVEKIAPNTTFRLVDDHYVGTNGISHANFRQTVHGYDIDNANFNVHVSHQLHVFFSIMFEADINGSQIARDGNVFSFGDSFFKGELPTAKPVEKRSVVMFNKAKEVVLNTFGLTDSDKDRDGSLKYFVKQDGSLALTWKVETKREDQWLASYVDAVTEPSVLGVLDFVTHATYEV
jgi:extracellular elastinolytic metalloproteinase